ncbi:hypothetical protein [Bradyrhizobium sp. HKCCYLR1051]|uniref:hypothetical protein n=1 Tax=Bradyrhizobium sp. HKCCYLR1051 TaxID=3420738 RepID=UPI003EBD25D5
MKIPLRKPLTINIYDSHLGIWQDDARDPSLRTAIYAPLIRAMTRRGWRIRADPHTLKHYRCISKDHRLGTRGTLHCEIEIAGRTVKVEFWSDTAPQINPNGRRYDFDRLSRMAYLDRLRVELEFKRITAWLDGLAPVTVKRATARTLPPMQRIAESYAASCHTDKALGHSQWHGDDNRRTKDGALLEQGQTVWLADATGRIIRGAAFYHLNNMWWVIAGGELRNEACHDLYALPPQDLRAKHNARRRRSRMERELATAVERMDFARAQLLKTLLFGAAPAFMIWARDKRAYYRAQYSGYTADRITAGKYTQAEAEAECRRVPHELEMVRPDGLHIRFDRAPPAQICAGTATEEVPAA